jgi:hypothetical protein
VLAAWIAVPLTARSQDQQLMIKPRVYVREAGAPNASIMSLGRRPVLGAAFEQVHVHRAS